LGSGRAGGDTPPFLEAPEHDFYAAATPVATLVIPDRLVAGFPPWDAGLNAFGLQGISEPISV